MSSTSIQGLKPSHPGALLREDILPALIDGETGKKPTKIEIATYLGMTRQGLEKILKEKAPVTPATAVRLGKLLGNGAQFWLDLQAQYDLRIAELAVNVDHIPTLRAA